MRCLGALVPQEEVAGLLTSPPSEQFVFYLFYGLANK